MIQTGCQTLLCENWTAQNHFFLQTGATWTVFFCVFFFPFHPQPANVKTKSINVIYHDTELKSAM